MKKELFLGEFTDGSIIRKKYIHLKDGSKIVSISEKITSLYGELIEEIYHHCYYGATLKFECWNENGKNMLSAKAFASESILSDLEEDLLNLSAQSFEEK